MSATETATVAETSAGMEPAGRCIRWIRPHPWTRWRVVTRGMVRCQARECLRCGLTQEAGLAI